MGSFYKTHFAHLDTGEAEAIFTALEDAPVSNGSTVRAAPYAFLMSRSFHYSTAVTLKRLRIGRSTGMNLITDVLYHEGMRFESCKGYEIRLPRNYAEDTFSDGSWFTQMWRYADRPLLKGPASRIYPKLFATDLVFKALGMPIELRVVEGTAAQKRRIKYRSSW